MQDLAQEQLGPIVLRVIEEVVRRGLFDDFALVHEDHAVRHGTGEAHFVGYAEHGHAVFGQTDHGVQNLFHHFRVECRGRFVEQHDFWLHAQGTGNCHTLLLTTGQLARELVGLLRDTHALQVMHGDLFRLALGHLAHPHRCQGAVLQDGQVREQVEVLEHHANFTTDRFDLLEVVGQFHAIDHDAALLVLFQTVEAADGGRLARTRRAAENDTFALLDVQVDVFQHVELAVPLVHALHLNNAFRTHRLFDRFTHEKTPNACGLCPACVPNAWNSGTYQNRKSRTPGRRTRSLR